MESYSYIQLYHPVSYRVAQKTTDPYLAIVVRACPIDFEINAPPILGVKNAVTFLTDNSIKIDDVVKGLRIADEIMVTEIQVCILKGNCKDFYTFCDGSYLLEPQGIIWKAFLRSKTTLTAELAYISRTIYENGRNNVWLIDRITSMEYQVPNERFPNFPETKIQPGTLVRVHSIHYPAGTLVSASHDLVLHPFCTSEVAIPNMTRLECDIRDTVWVQFVSNPDSSEFVQHFLASYSLMELLYSQVLTDSISSTALTWNFVSEKSAEMIYFVEFPIDLEKSFLKNTQNSSFHKNTIVSLRRITTDGYFSAAVFVRIKSATYKKNSTKIIFHVDPDYLIKIWGLNNFIELKNAKYQLEPSDLLWYLIDFYKEMLEDGTRFVNDLNFAVERNAILAPFLQKKQKKIIQPRKRSMFAEINADNRRKEDHRLSLYQKEAINAIVDGEPFVVVEGPIKSGKTTISTFAIAGILQEQICPFSDKCLFVVSENYHLEQLLAKLNKQNEFLRVCNEFDVRILNLLDLQYPDSSNRQSLIGVITFLLRDYRISIEDIEMLENCRRILYYRPKFVLIDQKTLVSVLSIVKNQISHVFVENAGIVPFFDILAIVKECRYLKQFVIIGDKFQNPTFSRIVLKKLPKLFDTVLNGIDFSNRNILHFQLNHVFHMNSGIIKILQEIFYSGMKIRPYIESKPIKLGIIRNFNFPIIFYDMVGEDKLLFSSTRTNSQHSQVAEMLIEKLLNYQRDLRIDILCYYLAQMEDIRFLLEKIMPNGFPPNIRLLTIDSVYDDRPDVSIIITTRTLDLKTFSMKYYPVNHYGQHYLKRVRIGLDDSKKLFSPDNYRYLFDKQRMMKCLSHAERTCFIIGSYELLREDPYWNKLLTVIYDYENFIEEPPFLPEKGKKYVLVTPSQNFDFSIPSNPMIYINEKPRMDHFDSVVVRKRSRI